MRRTTAPRPSPQPGTEAMRSPARMEENPDPFPGLAVVLAVEAEDWRQLVAGDLDEFVHATLAAAAARAGLPRDLATELAVTLADDAAVRELNREWRQKDRPTNVLSFPMRALKPGEPPGPLLGDLVLALETVRREAAEEGKRAEDHFRHLLVHGFLHCLGYDHIEEDDAEVMERLEILSLADLGIADPYASLEEVAAGAAL